ncbi:MAG TPA: VWA domain-containing protein [Candidatus Dormibacteraeota bacterium]|nr:VWA domain-containing protein [Candidatus Dormibacteraeota bacterium]
MAVKNMPGSFLYSRWDGTQMPDSLDADDILDAMSEELLAGGDLASGLQRLYRWGTPQLPGLEQMVRRLREQRDQELARHNLDTVIKDLEARVGEVIDTERAGIEQRLAEPLDPAARRLFERLASQRRAQLDQLPESLAGQIKQLRDYEFLDQGARSKFERLLADLQAEMLDRTFQGLKASIKNTGPQDLGRTRNMVRQLNKLLEQRARGEATDFAAFKEAFADMFPPEISTLEELTTHLQKQMAQLESLLRSLSPSARGELEDLVDDLLRDDGLRLELAKLGALMQATMPPTDFAQHHAFFGDDPLTLQQAMGLMDQLQALDRLESQLERGPFQLDSIDREALGDILGPDAVSQLDNLRRLSDILAKAGYLESHGRHLELTPRGLRQIGQSALRDIFQQLKKTRVGQHEMGKPGAGVGPDDELKSYEYGDPFLIDLQETLFRSLQRTGRSIPITVAAGDFVVHQTEATAQASTVLMIDMSRSMFLRGCFIAAKKVAMALDALIRTQYPRDTLYLVGFSSYAVELKSDSLGQMALNDYVSGTNIQHGLQLARSLLGRHRGNRQIIMVTDGEPTAHMENGVAQFNYPPTPETIHETLREVRACTRERITINTFMLENGVYLVDFVNQLTTINRGRAFFVQPDQLGEQVLVDYMAGRRRSRRRSA